jgi:hypothetical protein
LNGFRDALLEAAAGAHATDKIIEGFSGNLGTDALRPMARELLDDTNGRLDALFGKLEEWTGPIQRPRDVSDEMETLRAVAEAVRMSAVR